MNLSVQTYLRLSLLAVLLVPAFFCSARETLSKKQASNYIEHVIKSVFSAGHSGSYAQEIGQFISETKHSLKNKHYTAHELYPLILERALHFIEHKSRSYAQ